MKFSFVLFSLLSCLLLFSCKDKREEQLIGLWQEVDIINPELDAAIHKQHVFADTVGTATDSVQNQMLYGTNDIEAMRTELMANLDSFRKAQYYAIKATRFDFRRDSLMYIHSNDGVDSSKWYLDDDGALILDEARLKGAGNRIRMEILHLSDTLLKLQFTEQFLTSTAVFRPVKK
jgi:hypothetical protein